MTGCSQNHAKQVAYINNATASSKDCFYTPRSNKPIKKHIYCPNVIHLVHRNRDNLSGNLVLFPSPLLQLSVT